MRARGWVVLALGLTLSVAIAAAEVPKEPKPIVVDIKPIKDRLIVARDAAGGTYVVFREQGSESRAWYGTGKNLYEQILTGGSTDGDAWSLTAWTPRLAEIRSGSIDKRKDGTFFKQCDGKDDAVLTQLTGDAAKAVLDKFTFFSSALIRRPHLLARDESGAYYYVDRITQLRGGKGYRVFVGRKGAMKQMTLTDVASDSAGQVFSTKTGDLRLVRTEQEGKSSTAWVKGARKTELIPLDTDANSPLIFNDLGIYKFTGTICDNI
jgi:hypothetical protein